MSDFANVVRVTKPVFLGPNKLPEPVSVIVLNAENGVITSGGHNEDGGLQLNNKNSNLRASLHGNSGRLVLWDLPSHEGGPGYGDPAINLGADDCRIELNVAGQSRIQLNGKTGLINVGGNGSDGSICVYRADGPNTDIGQASILIDGETGDIQLKNADFAEDFDVSEGEFVVPGTLMVLDTCQGLRPSRSEYDSRVAGVVSGAGNYKPGLILDRQVHGAAGRRVPIALLGKVYCLVDADACPIEVGDLLTSSTTIGHAMKATDPTRAFGAVIGKALQPLASGKNLIPILINLH